MEELNISPCACSGNKLEELGEPGKPIEKKPPVLRGKVLWAVLVVGFAVVQRDALTLRQDACVGMLGKDNALPAVLGTDGRPVLGRPFFAHQRAHNKFRRRVGVAEYASMVWIKSIRI